MRKALHIVLGLLLGACVGLLPPFPAPEANAATVAVTNGVPFTDSSGNVLHGHGGGMIKVDGYYYWFGPNPYSNNRFRYISVYRSADLRTWQFRNHVLTEVSAPGVENLQRPHVIYNARTRQYVMFMRKENHPAPLIQNRVAVASSPTVDGDYRYRGSFRPLDHRSFDMNVFRDDDGRAYLISTTEGQRDLTIFRLTPDYLRVASEVTTLRGVKREAQTVFKRNGVYFLVTSGLTGWQPNQAKYATARSITGPWSRLAKLGDSITYGSQAAHILPVQGSATTSYLYLGDRWGNAWGGSINDSEYVWLPLTFPSNRSLAMRWYPRVSVNTVTGVVRGISTGHAYEELHPRHSGKCLNVRRFTNGSIVDDARSRSDGVGVVQQTCGTGASPKEHANQHWQVLSLGNGFHRLVARHSHKCLTVPGSSDANGTRVTQRTCSAKANQQWRITNVGGGYYRITARHSGKCLDIRYGSTTAGARAIQYTCKGSANQQWQRTRAPY
ncbi:RICIN domain-containing protein [Streptomyces smyrnaeus]|uniref:RICIN domain-containing protein n=1 Tax=Streptomyces smyrnaeus TaxID=1387713 RepID=UPI00367BC023